MLASLLPGLREVRTPLTVGYLWLFIGWALFGEHLPTKRPAGHGLIARLFDLHGTYGAAATGAAVSFIAYLLGAMLEIPVESRFVAYLLRPARYISTNVLGTDAEYRRILQNAERRFRDAIARKYPNRRAMSDEDLYDVSQAIDEFNRALRAGNYDLRARLLVARQELYGEYDRLASEASFRVNMFFPLSALAVVVGINLGAPWAVFPEVAAIVLLVLGATKHALSATVLRQAVVTGVVAHPAISLADKYEDEARGPGLTPATIDLPAGTDRDVVAERN